MRATLVFGFHLAVAVGLIGLATHDQASATGIEICDNGIDDTRGLIDCADPACADDPACDFEEGCCILFNCDDRFMVDGAAAGRVNGAELTCLDNSTQVACADHVGAPPPCAGDPDSQDCTVGLVCEDANLVERSCAQVPGCPQFAPGVAAPAASYTGLFGLAFLLAGTGLHYVRQRRS
jgi:hypothetical protein